ncbi:MAG: NUDIX hydrolase [Marinibacterium sp.]|nr:NUDIX hydrolase [Marinibacterium sp.]
MTYSDADFAGAKLALFIGPRILTVLRDDKPDIPFPAHWDLPGGGREEGETPQACALRETREEVGLIVPPRALIWARRYTGDAGGHVWFFAAHLPAAAAADIRLGDEGQCWRLMAPQAYCAHPMAVPSFRPRLAAYLDSEVHRKQSPPRERRGEVTKPSQ